MTDQKLMVCAGRSTGRQIDVSNDASVSMSLRGSSVLEMDVDDHEQMAMLIEDPTLQVQHDDRRYHPTRVTGNRVTMHEIWDLLDVSYPTVGKTPYKVNFKRNEDPRTILPALLKDTEWELDTVDAFGGGYRLEADLVSVLGNLRFLEEYTRGWLLFDSMRRTVSLRSGKNWKPESGIELRGRDLDRAVDLNVISEIIPFGYHDVVISTYNRGHLELASNLYTLSERRQLVWKNPGMGDSQGLLNQARDRLAKMSHPRFTYEGEIDLSKLGERKSLSLGDMVTVREPDSAIKSRVVAMTYKVSEPNKRQITLRGE